MLVSGVVLSIINIYNEVQQDLKDVDKKLGAKSAKVVVGTAFSWVGAGIGAKAGTVIGAEIGTAIFPGIGTVAGGFVIGLLGGVTGAFRGEQLGEYIIALTPLE